MTIIATDWADFYGGRQENFLAQQMRHLANPNRASTYTIHPDPTTGGLPGMRDHYVTQDRVGDRVRFHLHRGGNPLPLPAVPLKEMPWGWAEDFAHKPQNFTAEMVRRLHYRGSSSAVDLALLDNYRVEVSHVDGRVRYDLRAVDESADAPPPSIFD